MSKFDNILNSKTPINVIIDRPATGKTFAVLKLIVDRYLADGSTAIYAVRTRQEFRFAKNIFSDIFDIYIIDKTNNEYNHICYKNTKFYFCKIEKDKIVKIDKSYFCRLLPINAVKFTDQDIAVSPDFSNGCALDTSLVLYDVSEPCFALKDEEERFFALLSYAIDTNFMSHTKIFINSNFKHSVKNYVDRFNIDISKIQANNTYINEYITVYVGGDVSR